MRRHYRPVAAGLPRCGGHGAVTAEYFVGVNNYVKVHTRRLRETTGADMCEYTTSFNDIGFVLHNHATGGTTTIAYENLCRFKETQSYFVLFTKANQFGVVNKAQIEAAGQREALLAYCANISSGVYLDFKG